MYLKSILMLLSWPVIILLCWIAIRYALKLYQTKIQDNEKMEK